MTPAVETILRQTAEDHGVALADLLWGGPKLAPVRWAAMRRLRAVERANGKPRYSLEKIGAILRVHHTTVMYGLRKLETAA